MAAVAVAALLAPSAAGAATLDHGQLKLSFGKKFAKALKSSKTKVIAPSGRVARTRKVTFAISSGTGSLAVPLGANVRLGGTLGFKRGKRKLTFKTLSESASGSRGKFKSGRSTLFSESTTGKLAPEPGFTGLDGRGVSLKLTKAAAKKLNRKLRTRKFKKNMTAGTLTLDADRTVTFQSGNTRVKLDPGTASKLNACGVSEEALPPATVNGLNVGLPINGGSLESKTLDGTVNHAGGIRLKKSSPPHSSDLTEFQITLAPGGGSFSALASDIGNARVPIGPLDPAGQTREKALTATGGTVAVRGGTLRLSATAAGLLAGNFGCTTIQANDPLGTIEELSGPVS